MKSLKVVLTVYFLCSGAQFAVAADCRAALAVTQVFLSELMPQGISSRHEKTYKLLEEALARPKGSIYSRTEGNANSLTTEAQSQATVTIQRLKSFLRSHQQAFLIARRELQQLKQQEEKFRETGRQYFAKAVELYQSKKSLDRDYPDLINELPDGIDPYSTEFESAIEAFYKKSNRQNFEEMLKAAQTHVLLTQEMKRLQEENPTLKELDSLKNEITKQSGKQDFGIFVEALNQLPHEAENSLLAFVEHMAAAISNNFNSPLTYNEALKKVVNLLADFSREGIALLLAEISLVKPDKVEQMIDIMEEGIASELVEQVSDLEHKLTAATRQLNEAGTKKDIESLTAEIETLKERLETSEKDLADAISKRPTVWQTLIAAAVMTTLIQLVL